MKHMICGVLLVLLLFAGCGTNAAPFETVSPAAFTPGSPLPPPTNAPVLALQGDIAVKNVGEQLVLDMPTLEKLGLVKYATNDPWLKTKPTFTGVLLRDLLKFAGVSAKATNLHMTALDDYAVDIPVAEANKWPILVVTKTDGNYMPVSDKGPTRIIFPYDQHPEIDQIKYKDLWIWNLKTIDVK